MKIDDMFPSKWINADTVAEGPLLATIKDCQPETMRDGSSAFVLSFSDDERKITVTPTRGKQLAALFGKDSDDWMGKSIELYHVETQVGGEIKGGVRVRAPSNGKGLNAKPSTEDDLPYE